MAAVYGRCARVLRRQGRRRRRCSRRSAEFAPLRLTLIASFVLNCALVFYAFTVRATALAVPLPRLGRAAFFSYCAYARVVDRSPSEHGDSLRLASARAASADYTELWLEATFCVLAARRRPASLLPATAVADPVHGSFRRAGQVSARASPRLLLPALGIYLQPFLVLHHDIAHAKMTLPDTPRSFLQGKNRLSGERATD